MGGVGVSTDLSDLTDFGETEPGLVAFIFQRDHDCFHAVAGLWKSKWETRALSVCWILLSCGL